MPLVVSLVIRKYDVLTKYSKDVFNVSNVNIPYSLRVAKYNKDELQNLQDSKEIGKGLVKFQFKLGYVEAMFKQLFVAVSLNSYKNESFLVDV